jgi:integrase
MPGSKAKSIISLKTVYLQRRIPTTKAIRQRLGQALAQTGGDYVLTLANDQPFHEGSFRSNAWTRAFKAAGMDYQVTFTMRHSYADWALTLFMDPNRLA